MIDETAEEISEMQTHSSSIVAIKATRALESVLDREFATLDEFKRDIERNASALKRANRSHASLQNAMNDVVDAADAIDAEALAEAKSQLRESIRTVIERIETGKSRAASNLADELGDGETILTHDYSSTVLEGISLASADGKELDVFVTEARPRCIGRKSARELATIEGVNATLVTDSAGGYYLEECDRLVVGMDCIVDGKLYNRIGTHSLTCVADHLDVPAMAVGSATKVITEGFVFENEFRPASEVIREPVEGFAVGNPNYDATPISLLSAIVTDEGVSSPSLLLER